ncbi:MAG: 3-dehydroquinate synthase [Kiritimatiellia bacterium]
MRTININFPSSVRTCEIRIGAEEALSGPAAENSGKALIISDTHVAPLHGDKCAAALKKQGYDVLRAVVPAGEQSKSFRCLRRLCSQAVDSGLDRSSTIVALGGGMTGDLAGFAAAIYMRGIRLIQVPTTLLAMVDSSVGGKTAINLEKGKNLVGAFYQPEEVRADLTTLKTLPEKEYVSGLAEVVKYGVIRDAEFFTGLEENVDGLLERDVSVLENVVARCCEIKAEIVAADERESGQRAALNFGHTLAHALEQCSGYGKWLHGEAVSVGMVYASGLSVTVNGMPAADRQRIVALLKRLGLPTVPGAGRKRPPWRKIRRAVTADKKALEGIPRFVLCGRIGSVTIGREIDGEVLKETYKTAFAG